MFLVISWPSLISQVYNPVITYNYNGTPNYGIKIKTQLPFVNCSQMPTLIFEGYEYGQAKSIGLILNWYIWAGEFYNPVISSFGAYTPTVKLANENGYVVIFIDDKRYYNRFSVRAFAQGMYEQSNWFANWSISDEPLTGSQIINLPYQNAFSGNVLLPEGIWNAAGVGIGTTTIGNYKLNVAGKIRANEIVVNTTGADFVFAPDYKLLTLSELEAFIKTNQHLPGITPAKEMQENGVSAGEMQTKLLQKVEELTLYVIELKKENEEQKSDFNKQYAEQQKSLMELKKEIENLKSK